MQNSYFGTASGQYRKGTTKLQHYNVYFVECLRKACALAILLDSEPTGIPLLMNPAELLNYLVCHTR